MPADTQNRALTFEESHLAIQTASELVAVFQTAHKRGQIDFGGYWNEKIAAALKQLGKQFHQLGCEIEEGKKP